MSFARRLLTDILNDWSISAPTSGASGADTVTSHPYGASGRLTAVPWAGLQLDITE